MTDTFIVPLHPKPTPFISEKQRDLLDLLSMDKVAEAARQYLATRRRVFDSAKQVIENFAHLTPLAAGEYGVVARGCIRDADASSRSRSPCKRLEVQDETAVVAPVIVKFAWQMPAPALASDTSQTWAMTHDYQWVGDANATREALIGRMLNLLVTKGVCPNFSTLYNVMEIRSPPSTMLETFRDIGKHKEYAALMRKKRGPYFTTAQKPRGASILVICMDENAMDLGAFVSKVLSKHARATDLLQSMLCQIAAALYAADKHYGFRHNDLHDGNIMVTSTNEVSYVYKVGGRYFDVPTYGLSWKIVDYGMSTADKVFGKFDAASIHAFGHSSIEWGMEQECNPRHATELYDLSRLSNSLYYAFKSPRLRTWVRKHVDDVLTHISSRDRHVHVGAVLKDIHTRLRDAQDMSDRRRTAEYKALLRDTASATKSRGLLKRAFYDFADAYSIRKPGAKTHVYDTDASIDVSEKSFEGQVLLHAAEGAT